MSAAASESQCGKMSFGARMLLLVLGVLLGTQGTPVGAQTLEERVASLSTLVDSLSTELSETKLRLGQVIQSNGVSERK